MQSEIRVRNGSFKLYLSLGICAAGLIAFLAVWFSFQFGIILLGIGGVTVLAGGVGIYGRVLGIQDGRKLKQLEIRDKELDIEIKEAMATKARLMAGIAIFSKNERALLSAGSDMRLIEAVAGGTGEAIQPLVLPEPELDFYQTMSDPLQAYAIVAGQRVGKSNQAQHLAQYLTRNGVICLVIGTKADTGEWAGCKRYIGNEEAVNGLAGILDETRARLAEGRRIPQLAVFADDWINTTVLAPQLAEEFFIEASTRMLTAGIVPYFLLQSDSKNDWGIKHGAQLKNNFVHLGLFAPRENGRLNHNRLRAWVIYPGEKIDRPVTPVMGLPTLGDSEPDYELPVSEAQEDELSSDESRVSRDDQIESMIRAGADNREIARAVFGKANLSGDNFYLVKDIRQKLLLLDNGRN